MVIGLWRNLLSMLNISFIIKNVFLPGEREIILIKALDNNRFITRKNATMSCDKEVLGGAAIVASRSFLK